MAAVSAAAGTGPKLPIPPDLVRALPRPETPWNFSKALFERLQKQDFPPDKHFKTCEVWGSDPEYDFVLKYFMQNKPPGLSIRKIICIDNLGQTKGFEAALPAMEQAARTFRPEWDEEAPKDLRAKVTQRWAEQAQQFSPIELPTDQARKERLMHVRVLPLWHGSRHVESICEIGFTYFGKHHLVHASAGPGPAQKSTDIGYFGSGIYFTNSSQYAAMYSRNTLMLSWVSMRRPYPVVSDVPNPQKCSDMYKLEGRGAYQNSNAHFIPVVSIDPHDPECMVYHPCSQNDQPAWDEFVVFQSTQALPRFCIELGIDLPALPSGQTAYLMLSAIEAGQLDTFRKLSGAIASLSSQERNGFLLAAASFGQVEICEILLAAGAQPVAVNDKGQNALHMAVERDKAPVVKQLLIYKELLASRNKEGRTPLLEAACAGHVEVFKMLLQEGSDLSAVDDQGRTALHVAAKQGRLAIVQLFITPKESGWLPVVRSAPNIIDREMQLKLLEATTKEGWTPLLEAACAGHADVCRALIKAGASIHAKTKNGWNALHLASDGGFLQVVQIFTAEPGWIPFLSAPSPIEKDKQKPLLDAFTEDEDPHTPLLLAAKKGHRAVCEALLGAGAKHYTALRLAARAGHRRICEALLKAGANPEMSVDNHECSVLHLGALYGHLAVVQLFLSNKKLLNLRDKYGQTPLLFAANSEVFEALLSSGADPRVVDQSGRTVLHWAVLHDNLAAVQQLASNNKLLNATDKLGRTPLHFAASKEVCEALIKAGADTRLVSNNETLAYGGWNALHWAAWRGALSAVQFLATDKGLLNARDQEGCTPLLLAASREACEALLKAGADLMVIDKHGCNALHRAAYYGRVEVVRMLASDKKLLNAKMLDHGPGVCPAFTPNNEWWLKPQLEKRAELISSNRLYVLCAAGQQRPEQEWFIPSLVDCGMTWPCLCSKGTPLLIAADLGHTKACEALLKAGADLSTTTDYCRNNVVHLAASRGHLEVIKMVVVYKELLGMRNKDGKTPRDVVCENCVKYEKLSQLRENILQLLPPNPPKTDSACIIA